jgi:hypothetical protein
MRIVKVTELPAPSGFETTDEVMTVRNKEIVKSSYTSVRESFLHLTTDGSIFPTWINDISDAVKYVMYLHKQFENSLAAFEAGLAGETLPSIYEVVILAEDDDENGTAGFLNYTRSWSFHEEDELIELVAAPKVGYEFDEWTGDVAGISNVKDPYAELTVTQNAIITATFKETNPYE